MKNWRRQLEDLMDHGESEAENHGVADADAPAPFTSFHLT